MNIGPQAVPADASAGCGWPSAFTLNTSAEWPSGLYRAKLTNASNESSYAEFVVRPSTPGITSRTLVCVPFATFAAYDRWDGTPAADGRCLYDNESPARATKVSFDRPGVWCTGYEEPFFAFLDNTIVVEYCSSIDLHTDGANLFAPYQLLVSIGHDEYWSVEMRDAVESFVRGGGNVAFFSANTCWWQVRFEDNNRTMVCYKDATLDPVAAENPVLASVRWSHAPVLRPENTMTGVSFAAGAGCWSDPPTAMANASYTTRFAAHWVFAGTRLTDGSPFATGCIGYETDAADYVEEGGIPWSTGRDGSPPSFVILATADLGDWRRFGQGGAATMGIYHRGGTVFTAATIGWSNGFGQPAVAQITKNVLTKLGSPWPGHAWEVVGEANGITAMVVSEGKLFGTTADKLWWRPPVGQNLHWTAIDIALNVVAMAAPTEVEGNPGDPGPRPIKLFAADSRGKLWWREPLTTANLWQPIGDAPGSTLAAVNKLLFTTSGNQLLSRSSTKPAATWSAIGAAPSIIAMTALNGRLYAATANGKLLTRDPVTDDVPWSEIGSVPSSTTALAGARGRLFLATGADKLLWSAVPPRIP